MIDVRLALADSPPPGNIPIKIRCRESGGDSSPSMCVYPDGIKCFHCGFSVPFADKAIRYLLGKQDVNLYQYESSTIAAHRDSNTLAAELDPLPWQLAGVYAEFLWYGGRKHRKQWLYDRGLTNETIEWYNLGHDGTRFTIPIYNKRGDLISIRFRRDDAYGLLDYHENEISKYTGYTGRNGLYLYPAHELAQDRRDFIVVCEGELDALRLRQEGIPACSPTQGIGSFKHVPRLLKSFPWIRRISIAADQDEPGRAGAAELMKSGSEAGYIMKNLEWGEQYKDVTELFKAGHTFVT